MQENQIIIFTDGASKGNPGRGGWGAIVVAPTEAGKKVFEMGDAEKDTTNNRMEISAALGALSFVRSKGFHGEMIIYTDSNYLINGITKWVNGWARNGWRTKTGGEVSNRDLWEDLLEVKDGLDVVWRYLGGHVGIVGNERADEIASDLADGKKVSFYDGLLGHYGKDILNMKHDETAAVAKKSSRSHAGTKAYSYLSLVDGKLERHQTWAETEARVKGKKAKFKKAISPEHEREIRAEWGM